MECHLQIRFRQVGVFFPLATSCSSQMADWGIFTNMQARTATKIRFMYPFLGIARTQSQLPHSCVWERFIYSQDRST